MGANVQVRGSPGADVVAVLLGGVTVVMAVMVVCVAEAVCWL